ncbi:hypothetical protein V493_07596, partial [Pseudogymnoascus sp. VKM F-4281 (FW-2241)]
PPLPSAPESTESNIRYAAYVTRIRTALLSAQRYVAYTSDVGESFRPVAHPNLVRAAYGISWTYLAGDVAHEGYKAYCANQRTLHPTGAADAVATGAKLVDAGVSAKGEKLALVTPARAVPGDSEYGPPYADYPLHSPVRGPRDEERQEPAAADVGACWPGIECRAGVAVFV